LQPQKLAISYGYNDDDPKLNTSQSKFPKVKTEHCSIASSTSKNSLDKENFDVFGSLLKRIV